MKALSVGTTGKEVL